VKGGCPIKSLKSVSSIALLLAFFLFPICTSGTEAAIIQLNSTLPTDSLIYDWQASPDSSTVVYSTGPVQRTFRNALFSVGRGRNGGPDHPAAGHGRGKGYRLFNQPGQQPGSLQQSK
jgi:hypothetical protein